MYRVDSDKIADRILPTHFPTQFPAARPTALPTEPIMPMLPSRHYVSEHTQFIRELIESKPDLPAKQREGRALWWDKTPDALGQTRQMEVGRVPMTPYVYQTE
jgi:hypothetical protein